MEPDFYELTDYCFQMLMTSVLACAVATTLPCALSSSRTREPREERALGFWERNTDRCAMIEISECQGDVWVIKTYGGFRK